MNDEKTILESIIRALGTSHRELLQNIGSAEQIKALFRHRLSQPQVADKPNKD